MTAFRTYADWMRNSNEAGIYREAFDLGDKMPREVLAGVFEVIFRASEAAWREYSKETR